MSMYNVTVYLKSVKENSNSNSIHISHVHNYTQYDMYMKCFSTVCDIKIRIKI